MLHAALALVTEIFVWVGAGKGRAFVGALLCLVIIWGLLLATR